MRLWVRSGVQMNLSFCSPRAVGSASDTNDKVLYQPNNLSLGNLIQRKGCWKEKTTLPNGPICSAVFFLRYRTLSTSWLENINLFFSRYEEQLACAEQDVF